MPGIVMDEICEGGIVKEINENSKPVKENSVSNMSPRSTLSLESPCSRHPDVSVDGVVDTSIEQLYENVCDMQSSDQSQSRQSFGSYGEESRIDSELRHLVGGEMKEIEIMEEEEVDKLEDDTRSISSPKKGNSSGVRSQGSWSSLNLQVQNLFQQGTQKKPLVCIWT